MCAPWVAPVAAVFTAVASVVQGQSQAREAKKARTQAQQQAEQSAAQADQEMNRQNKKTPNVQAITDANTNAAKGGIGSTLLTGTDGIDPTALNLSKNNLLGA